MVSGLTIPGFPTTLWAAVRIKWERGTMNTILNPLEEGWDMADAESFWWQKDFTQGLNFDTYLHPPHTHTHIKPLLWTTKCFSSQEHESRKGKCWNYSSRKWLLVLASEERKSSPLFWLPKAKIGKGEFEYSIQSVKGCQMALRRLICSKLTTGCLIWSDMTFTTSDNICSKWVSQVVLM